jgi:hypothetical protein
MNQEVTDLDSAVDSTVAPLSKDFAFTKQEEAKIVLTMGTLRDAFGRWLKRQNGKNHSN